MISGRSAEFELDYRVNADDGERTLQMSVRPIDVDGRRGAIVTHKDITELERAHGAARATKEFFELILDSLPLNIAYVNRRREFVYANRGYEEWFRLPLAALQGRRLEEMTTPDSYRQMAPRVESALSGSTVEYLARTRRGDDEHDLAVTYLPHRVDDEVAGFFAVVQDVTVERRLEQELRHAQKLEAIGQLTGGIAHDFNNLLSVVIGNLQLLERPLKGDARLGGHIATALRAALRGADLTRRLLAFARQQVARAAGDEPGAAGVRHRGPHPSHARPGDRGRQHAAGGLLADLRRPRAARVVGAQPRHQRPRRDAGRRPADARDAQPRLCRGRSGAAPEAGAGRLRRDQRERHRASA